MPAMAAMLGGGLKLVRAGKPDGRPRIAAARMAMIVLKTALSFGKACRLPGCAEFKAIV